eukprot:CAMPEP_0197715574 /NCGR_PEP_ID=MMETSP1434-20131217/717_1 /TAXON_ID=265543 /ORGANISM="Minutocellus polymorphus, Strain CCMP3303" /LENGTH=79 /DNA_ID=CAMNT_0043299729 /DNA_START=266 /DNA_END=505 /DNA_ORIENTATION=-
MGFSLYNLFKAGLLFTNAALIINKPRFLAKYGWDEVNPHTQSPLVVQGINLYNAIQYLKVPVIACNVIVIFFELILGGT